MGIRLVPEPGEAEHFYASWQHTPSPSPRKPSSAPTC